MDQSNGTHQADHDGANTPSAISVIQDLNSRALTLIEELETFRQHLRSIRQEGSVEVAHFRSTVQSEVGMLERLLKKPDNESTTHIARSSNLPFLETVWATAKKSKKVTALQKRIYFNSKSKSLSQAMHHVGLVSKVKNSSDRKNAAVTVDAITNDGLTWIKVSLVTNTRLLFDLAKQGWQSEGSEDEDADAVFGDDEGMDVPIVKNAKDLCQAAQSYRAKTRIPAVHLILPRVIPGETDEIDAILDECRAAGAVVFCGDDLQHTLSLQEALPTMAPDPFSLFSDTLNIDCTILLALVSEFSHARVSKEPWFHKALQRQVEIEGNENLLPALLYPAMAEHKLVCTKEAAKRMREIVDTIGTPSEAARTAIMMGDDESKSQQELVEEMQHWSAYEVPKDWQLPIRIVDENEGNCLKNLPEESTSVSKNMTAINRSVFLYGWATGNSTITSNRTVVKQLEADLEKYEDLDESVWPSIWLCPTARSLVGKEKRGVKKEDRKEGAWPLPDPLRREEQRRNGLDVLSGREGHKVEDLRPNGYPCKEVLEAKNAARRLVENGSGSSGVEE
ncbi:hypothetical protein PRZ48_003074 [Zasmidium cellare]|uniref:DUF1308 domain-containing protein n=1 Tax=Zasmidium cellare TaxID=395010 RepID=A0ABR0EU21_ZASCE|nr:hypothetical protein PRZ48_003074 [Zasmidium cellare]